VAIFFSELRHAPIGVVMITFDVIATPILLHIAYDLAWGRARADRERRWLARRLQRIDEQHTRPAPPPPPWVQ